MATSAYDRWKTNPPSYPPQPGECLECGDETWTTGRTLLAQHLRKLPKTHRRAVLRALKSEVDLQEIHCLGCGREAIDTRFDPCRCGASTAKRCTCP